MSGRLSGKRAFVTAAGAGIGRATALAFAREGAHVVASDIDEAALATLDGVTAERLDVTDPDAVIAAAARWPDREILFNAAGWVPNGSVLETSDADWARALDLNVTSMVRTIRAFLPGMLARGAGSIVNVSSVASSIKAAPNRFAYSATKAAVIGITKAVSADFVTQGIRCNAICPGTVDTPSLTERLKATGDEAAARIAFIARQPMGRLGTADEIAHLAVYLASDEAAFTTGQAHVIDGGWAA
ncbi:MAG: SDR family oxidoreductase [Phenylobacterium sp.]|uniref:SDR family oxidoreductase n=1 Tax=Phenylobacterium sp. TaxID=1871053 RepID=UPI001A634DF9|nr:SDR family oxidoreductase [Phenylobacterium sp.]MBL8554958.1 SDR family oxidoreductase [Phenylobacterium sp.]